MKINRKKKYSALRSTFWGMPYDTFVEERTSFIVLMRLMNERIARYALEGQIPSFTIRGNKFYRKWDILLWLDNNYEKYKNKSVKSIKHQI